MFFKKTCCIYLVLINEISVLQLSRTLFQPSFDWYIYYIKSLCNKTQQFTYPKSCNIQKLFIAELTSLLNLMFPSFHDELLVSANNPIYEMISTSLRARRSRTKRLLGEDKKTSLTSYFLVYDVLASYVKGRHSYQ